MNKKILHLYPNLEIGGASKVILSISQILSEQNKNFIISKNNINYDQSKHRSIFLDFDINNKNYLVVKILYYLRYCFFLYDVIKKNKIDTIINHHRYLSPATYLVSKILKLNVIFYAHSNPSKIFFFKKEIFGNNIISVSKGVKNTLINNYKINSHKIQILYNGIKPLNSLSDIKIDNLKKNLKLKRRVFSCIAHFRPIKRQIFLLKAYKKILKNNLDSSLILYGYGEQKDQILNYIKKNNMYNNVTLLSNATHSVEDVLNISDFTTLPSEREGLGLSIIESFSVKKPVIGTNISGINEVIINNYNGFLFKKKSIKKLSYYIDLLLNDYTLCNQLGTNSYQTFLQKFSYKIYKKNILNYFK